MADKPYRDPKTTKIEDWKWNPLEPVQEKLGIGAIPDYIQKGFGGFMNEQAGRSQRGEMTPRDLIKAYTIAQSSIGRGGLSHATASKTGMKLPNTGGEVRPEGSFSEWLGSREGQQYLDAAERGEIHPSALEDIRAKFAPFGKQNAQVEAMKYAANEFPAKAKHLNAALTGHMDKYRDFAEQLKGIAGAKSGFIGSLLGRGDLPTLDARQLNLHAAKGPAGVGSMMARGKGTGAREAVDRLASRQSAMGFGVDPDLIPHYQHLAHHAVWDKASGTETTHDDLMRAMRGYAEGGNVNPTVEQMRRAIEQASTSAGMKSPVVANKALTGLKDFHQSLGDAVQEGVGRMKAMVKATPFKYEVGHRIFTKGSAEKNREPYEITARTMVGNQPMRHPAEEGKLPKVMKHPETGETMRTPYEPGYWVRQHHGDGEYSEYTLPEKAILGHLAAGGQPKDEPALPLNLPRAPSMSTQDMQAHVDRIARQQLGEHVTRPGDTTNLSGRSKREAERIKGVGYGLRPTGTVAPSSEYQGRVGDINVALPGDQTIADTMLEHINDKPVESQQEGGARYGAGKMHLPESERAFWASGEQPAQMFQNKVTELARMTGENPRVIAHHLAMGRIANNFAQHFADANLKAIESHMVEPENAEQFNQIIRMGYEKLHPKTKKRMHISFPEFPGVENPDAAYMAMQKNPEMRKWFNNRMKTPNITQALGMPSGLDIEHAISEPALRNMEISLTGHSVGKMVPGAELRPGAKHGTYSHDILGEALGHAPELAPLDIAFPDASAHIRREYAPKDFTGTMQKVFPHQIVDPQHLDQMSRYYEMLRKTRGYADGGEVSQDEMLAHVMLHKADGGAITPDAPDMPDGTSTDVGYYEGGPSDGALMDPMQYHADGGSIKSADIGVEEAPDMPVKLYMPPGKGGMPVGGVDFQPEVPGQQMAAPPSQGQPPQGAGMPQMGQAPAMPPTGGAGAPTGPQSNILQMTPQGQAMSAMKATPAMKKGGGVKLTTAQMKAALKHKKAAGGFEGSKISDIGMTERPL